MALLLPSSARNQRGGMKIKANRDEVLPHHAMFAAQLNQIVDGLLFSVKRTVEPTFQIIVKPTLPGSKFCQFHCVESFGQIKHLEEVEHSFLLPGQKKGYQVCFSNLEDSTRALNCIRRLLDTAPTLGIEEERRYVTDPSIHVGITRDERVGQTEVASREIRETELPTRQTEVASREIRETELPTRQTEVASGEIRETELPTRQTQVASGEIRETELPTRQTQVASGAVTNPSTYINIPEVEEEHIGNEVANANAFDQHLYLQNTRVIMAMMAIFLATIGFTVGLNPPASINTLSLKMTFQITFWIGAVSSLAALLLLGLVTPTSADMQASIFRCSFVAISVSLLCVVVAFSTTTVTMSTNPVTMIAGGVIGAIGIIIFLYFTSTSVRGIIFGVTGLSFTQHPDNTPYSLTSF